MFTIYASKLFEIAKAHFPDVCAYADDTQLYLSFKPDSEDNQTEAVDAVQGCIEDIRAWRAADQIKLNEDKSEVILTGIQQQLNKVNIAYLEIIQASVPIVRSCHKLGVIQSVLCSFNSSLP